MMINTDKNGTFSVLYGKVFRCCMRFADDYTQESWTEFGKASSEICIEAVMDPCEPIIRRMLIGFAAWKAGMEENGTHEVDEMQLKEMLINFWHIAVACIQKAENYEGAKENFIQKYCTCGYENYLMKSLDTLGYIERVARIA